MRIEILTLFKKKIKESSKSIQIIKESSRILMEEKRVFFESIMEDITVFFFHTKVGYQADDDLDQSGNFDQIKEMTSQKRQIFFIVEVRMISSVMNHVAEDALKIRHTIILKIILEVIKTRRHHFSTS